MNHAFNYVLGGKLLVAALFTLTLFSTAAAQPHRRHDSVAHLDSISLSDLLKMLSKMYKVGICNPKQLKGAPIAGTLSRSTPVADVVAGIAPIERAVKVYLLYQDNVIYVGDRPFPKPFVPNFAIWPCHKL